METWIQVERLHLGAEAEVNSGFWYGKPAIEKIRQPRTWRHPDLDRRLTKKRMTSEVKLMIKLRAKGVEIPAIWDVDFEEGRIVMERIEGQQLMSFLRSNKQTHHVLEKVGRTIRKLHRQAVVHGDLSTNNILIDQQNEAKLIDLGLANMDYEVESYGIDLHVLHEILRASHPEIDGAMEAVIKGYLALDEEYGAPALAPGGKPPTAKEVVKRLESIKTRVRYHGG
ncbi:MAG TPA: Kae1-associated serine/threonine protein kinase [Candidatus Poseidoniales archaeon]|jgi:Kae1-associated kinase Bud32|nr:MAG: Kae1-associated kinase Bud32 [Euryarchaeota archaeon]HIF46444.1 Kae1-associated serine/threonine protein kinase [Candidatus Poseidoniales archaeon]HIL65616.1 Kae1-associated serine/threonine protein kinase [Candidatus Poseidoniales archaeon]